MAKLKKIQPEERFFSLVLALVASNYGLTKAELLSTVYGYSKDYADEAKRKSLEKKFERDKTILRNLGIPIQVKNSPGDPENNQNARYTVSKEDLQIPQDLKFNESEISLLRAATLAWEDTTLAAHSKQALIKIASLQPDVDLSNLDIKPKVVLADTAAPDLSAAIDQKNTVTFFYQKPGEKVATKREVAPYRLHRADGRWHLIGFDLVKKSWRVFLVSRISDSLKINSDPVDESLANQVGEQIERLNAMQNGQRASVAVEVDSEAHTRLKMRASGLLESSAAKNISEVTGLQFIVLEIPTLDYFAFADELLQFAGSAIPLVPTELRARFVEKLREIKTLHKDV